MKNGTSSKELAEDLVRTSQRLRIKTMMEEDPVKREALQKKERRALKMLERVKKLLKPYEITALNEIFGDTVNEKEKGVC